MSEALSERQAFLVLNGLPLIGPVSVNRLLTEFGGNPRAVLAAPLAELSAVTGLPSKAAAVVADWRAHFDLAREEEWLARSSADFVGRNDPAYPASLREIHDPPTGLYRIGKYDLARPCVAVIGSRRTSRYGLETARTFGAELARAGFCVVSGMARGIDTAAHQGALEAGGVTVAVLGTGPDIVYPPENIGLYRQIPEKGAVLSEFTIGRRSDRQSFAMRNRIVSGMSRAVLVVESDTDGGAMITARFAMEQGRTVCAIPGRIDQPTSRGCHQLIRDGATLVTSVDELLAELNYLSGLCPMEGVLPRKGGDEARAPVGEAEARVLACFAGGEVLSMDAICSVVGLGAQEVSASLLLLELSRHVSRQPDGRYEAV